MPYFQNFFDIMVKKMFDALKKRYSNLGLSDEQLNLVAPMAVLGLSDDADEAAIAARASESYISDMLKNMQSQSDKIRSLEKKPKEDKGVVEPKPGDDDKMDKILSLLNEQKTSNEALQARLAALEGASRQKDFDSLVSGIMKELNIPASLSDLCKSGLSSDMDEQSVRNKLGATKKTLVDSGVTFSETTPGGKLAQTEAEKEEALQWAKEHAIPEGK